MKPQPGECDRVIAAVNAGHDTVFKVADHLRVPGPVVREWLDYLWQWGRLDRHACGSENRYFPVNRRVT